MRRDAIVGIAFSAEERAKVPMGGINIDTQTHMDSEKLFIVGDWWQPTQFQPAKETICLYESK